MPILFSNNLCHFCRGLDKCALIKVEKLNATIRAIHEENKGKLDLKRKMIIISRILKKEKSTQHRTHGIKLPHRRKCTLINSGNLQKCQITESWWKLGTGIKWKLRVYAGTSTEVGRILLKLHVNYAWRTLSTQLLS